MKDEEIRDEVTEKAIQSIKNFKANEGKSEVKNLLGKMANAAALNIFLETNNREGLLLMGRTHAEIDKINRRKGQPKKTLYKCHQIVQLVYKQNLQAGVAFTNSAGKEFNECFIAVAEHQGVGVNQIVEQYKKVPAEQREKIKNFVRRELAKEKKLYNR